MKTKQLASGTMRVIMFLESRQRSFVYAAVALWLVNPKLGQELTLSQLVTANREKKGGVTQVATTGGVRRDTRDSNSDQAPIYQTTPPDTGPRALTDMQIGKLYESYGRLKDAEVAYLRVIRDGPAELREKANNALAELIKKQDSRWYNPWWNAFVWEPLGFVGKWILRGAWIIFLIWPVSNLAAFVGKGYGKNKFEVIALIDTTQNKLGSAFGEVIAVTLEKMRYHFAQGGPIRGEATLPVIAGTHSVELAGLAGDLAVSVHPEWLGKVIAWLVSLVSRPEYSIRGVIESAGQQITMSLRVQQRGRTLDVWDRTFDRDRLIDVERDLAYEVLIFLTEHINYGHAA